MLVPVPLPSTPYLRPRRFLKKLDQSYKVDRMALVLSESTRTGCRSAALGIASAGETVFVHLRDISKAVTS